MDSGTFLREGIAAARSGDRLLARSLLAQVTDANPANELAWLWRANVADDPSETVGLLRQVLALNPDNGYAGNALPDALVRAGAAAAQTGDRAAARQLLAEATDRAPRNETAWLWRAGLTDNPAEAVAFLQHVLAINPDNPRAKQGLAQLQPAAPPTGRGCPLCGQPAEQPVPVCGGCNAVLTLDDPAVFDRPTGADRGRMEQAAQRLYAAATANPSNAAAVFHLGLAYLNLGYADEGLKAVQSAARGRTADPAWKADVARLQKHRQSPVVENRLRAKAEVQKPVILIVDDSPTVRKLVTVTLTAAGYAVREAGDGQQVAEVVRQYGVPKLFLLDVNMPGMDGFQLCKLLRQSPDTAKVPAVFLTGKDGFFNKLRGQWAGAAEYLTKPFNPQKLLDTVGRLVPVTRG